MDYKQVAKQVLETVGGRENVSAAAVCMTRLRLSIRNEEKVDMAKLKKIDGVLGVVEDETLQIVFGPGKVNKVGDEFAEASGIAIGSSDDAVEDVAAVNKANRKSKQNSPVQVFLRKIANIFVPLLPGIIAAGLINGLCNVINVTSGNAYLGVWWYQAIRTVGWALFAYLPILVGVNAAKEFKGSPVLGGIAGALFISNAGMPLLATINDAGIVLPITNSVYNPSNGGLIAALISGMFFAFLEKKIRKVMPEVVSTFFTPLLTVIIGVFAAVLIIQPFGAFLTSGIFGALNFLYTKMGIVGGYILSAGFLPLVALGLHQALTPIHALLNDPNGATQGVNYLLPILMMAGGGQVGAGLAIYLKTKNKKLKRMTRDALPVGILGIGEPMMYAVTLPLGKPFITACLGAGVGGVLASLFHLGTVSQGVSGLFGLLIVVPGTQLYYIIAMVAAYVGGFVVTYFFGVDEKRIEEIYGQN